MLGLGTARKELDELRKRRSALDSDWGDGVENSPLLNFYVKVMTQLLGAERCSIFISDPATGKIWLKCGTGVVERGIEVDREESVVGRVVSSGEPVNLHGLEGQEGAHKAADAATGFVTRSILCIPIRTLDGKRIAGAIEVLNKRDGDAFSAEDHATLEETAHFLQRAIEGAYYRQEALDTLGRTLRVATAAAGMALLGFLVIAGLLILYWITSTVWGT